MQQSHHQVGASCQQSEYYLNDNLPRHNYIESSIEDLHHNYFDDAAYSFQGSAFPDDFHGAFSEQYRKATSFGDSYTSNTNLDIKRGLSLSPRPSATIPTCFMGNDSSSTRDLGNYTEVSRPDTRICEQRPSVHLSHHNTHQPYHLHDGFFPLRRSDVEPTQTLPCPSLRDSNAPLRAIGETKFASFGGLFNSSGEAKQYRHVKTRFDRRAYNEDDHTIAGIEAERTRHVERIYNAMVRIDKARDNYKSVAMKRWTREPHYPSDLVEAYAHKVFDCLLEQAKDGFRGWHHNDYVVDDRKGNDEDRDIDCEGRLNNIILALEQEKTICEDVMNSACQIRMFVNAPVAYSNRKHQNRIGNSKRPNGGAKEEPQPGSRPHKVRKIGDRRARNRSPVVSISASVDQEQVHELAGLASFVAPSSRQLAPSPLEKVYHSLQVPTAHRISMLPQHPSTLVDQAQTNVLLEPMISPQMLPHTPRLVPKPHVSSASPSSLSLLSPPILPQGNFSAPVTPDQIGSRNTNVLSGRWIPTDTFSKFPYGNIQQPSHANDLLFNHVADWSQNVSPYYPCETGTRNNLFEHHPELGVALADVEQQSMSPFDRNTINNLNVSPFEQQQYGPQ